MPVIAQVGKNQNKITIEDMKYKAKVYGHTSCKGCFFDGQDCPTVTNSTTFKGTTTHQGAHLCSPASRADNRQIVWVKADE